MIPRIARLIRRNRDSSLDFGIIVLGLLVMAFISYEVDLFAKQGSLSGSRKLIDLDESLFLGILLAVGMFIYSVRRLIEQKKELRRRIGAEQQARELAFQDPLTGLANRRQFDEALAAAVLAPPAAGAAHAVFLLDLNGFKRINDLHGHGAGDEVLVAVAQRLRRAIGGQHLVARLGGDEFVVLARHLAGAESATSHRAGGAGTLHSHRRRYGSHSRARRTHTRQRVRGGRRLAGRGHGRGCDVSEPARQ